MKTYRKNIKFLFLTLILFFSFPFKIVANTSYETSKNYSYQKNNINVYGTYPVISNLNNQTFENIINSEILALIDQIISSNNDDSSKQIAISYKTYLSGNNLSIVLFFKNILTSEVTVKSIVLNVAKSQKVTINSILGANGISYANKVVSNQSNTLNLKSAKVTENTAFYINNNKIYIIYGAGEVTFPQKGNITIQIDPNKISNYTISKNLYYKKSDYNVKMVPLRTVLENLGFKISWSSSSSGITVLDGDNTFISYIVPGKNSYSKGSFVGRALEFAPEIVNGTTYVPISFFSEIVGLLYSVDSSENIIISKYEL